MTPAQRDLAARIAWKQGRLGYLLRPHQRSFRAAWREAKKTSRKFFGCCNRGFGKSTDLFIEGLEEANKTPNLDVYFIAPVEKKLDDYLEPIRKKILRKAPPDFFYSYSATDNIFRFANNSRMLIRGCNNKSYEDLRGGTCGLALVDEARNVDNLEDLIDNVLMPACAKSAKENPGTGYLVAQSTPPPTTDHPLEGYYQDAEVGGYYFHSSIYDCDYPDDIIQTFMKEAGGATSMTWRIEYMAERGLVDDELKIIPEFDNRVGFGNVITTKEWNDLRDPVKHPEHQFYRWFESVDIGTVDKRVMLASFYSFLDATLYIGIERVSPKGETTHDFGDELTKVETDSKIAGKVYLRTCDIDGAQLALDLLQSHKIAFYPTDKARLIEMVNKVRVMMGATRIKIAEQCVFLIGSLHNGMWKDHNKKDFARSKTYGHFDAVAALIYKVRNLVESNPIPPTFNIPTLPGTNVIPPWTMAALPKDPNKASFSYADKLRKKLKPAIHGPVKL